MKWGTTPSEPGWYWFRADCNDDPHIIKLVERDELLVQYGPSTRATLPWLKDNTPNPQWAGPIPMPGQPGKVYGVVDMEGSVQGPLYTTEARAEEERQKTLAEWRAKGHDFYSIYHHVEEFEVAE